ncbi:MAG TPA: hypothetical protein PKD64_17890 [Pirellulaceae bacterium]|nr:hypothetical protein [Pirellulaceae bacterium]HMO94061.1 hypothetical protein [Pirellulaceae bacterium]HMP70933.1 hypothetical protein [Pirellulaceae bacterium]
MSSDNDRDNASLIVRVGSGLIVGMLSGVTMLIAVALPVAFIARFVFGPRVWARQEFWQCLRF